MRLGINELISSVAFEFLGGSSFPIFTFLFSAGRQQGLGSQWEHPLPWRGNSHWCAWALQPRIQVLCLLGTQGKSLLHSKLYLWHVSRTPSCQCRGAPRMRRAPQRCYPAPREVAPLEYQRVLGQGATRAYYLKPRNRKVLQRVDMLQKYYTSWLLFYCGFFCSSALSFWKIKDSVIGSNSTNWICTVEIRESFYDVKGRRTVKS